MIKKLIVFITILSISTCVFAGEWKTRTNQYTRKPDFVRGDDPTFTNVSVSNDLTVWGVLYVEDSPITDIYVPYTGATTSVDLGAFALDAYTVTADNYFVLNADGQILIKGSEVVADNSTILVDSSSDLIIENKHTNDDIKFYVLDNVTRKQAMRIDATNANVGIWNETPAHPLDVTGDIHSSADIHTYESVMAGLTSTNDKIETLSDRVGITATIINDSNFPAPLTLKRARGTSPSAMDIRDGDDLGEIRFSGFISRGENYKDMITILGTTNGEIVEKSSYPSKLIFKTTTVNETEPTDKIVLDNAGNFYPYIHRLQDLGGSDNRWKSIYLNEDINFNGGGIFNFDNKFYFNDDIDVTGEVSCDTLVAESSSFPVTKSKRTTAVTGGAFGTTTGIASGILSQTQTTGDMTDGFGGGFVFSIGDNGLAGDSNYIARMYARRDGADDEGALEFFTGSSGADSAMIMRADGKIGIGKTDPDTLLDVNGSIQAAGDIMPSDSDTYDLGSSTALWDVLYATGLYSNNNALYISSGDGAMAISCENQSFKIEKDTEVLYIEGVPANADLKCYLGDFQGEYEGTLLTVDDANSKITCHANSELELDGGLLVDIQGNTTTMSGDVEIAESLSIAKHLTINNGNINFGPGTIVSSNGVATGLRSIALGGGSVSTATDTFAVAGSVASAIDAAAFGRSIASGNASFASGQDSLASGDGSAAFCAGKASGFGSFAAGADVYATGTNSVAFGRLGTNASPYSLGIYDYGNEIELSPSGVSTFDGSLDIADNINCGAGSSASGTAAVGIGYNAVASGTAVGAWGSNVVVEGTNNNAYGSYIGISDSASGTVAIGCGAPSGTVDVDNSIILAGGNIGFNTLTPTAEFHRMGSVATEILEITGSYTASSEEIIIADAGLGYNLTVTLPSVKDGIDGRLYTIKCVDDTGGVWVKGDGVETIDGEGSWTLVTDDSMTVVATGDEWKIVSDSVESSGGGGLWTDEGDFISYDGDVSIGNILTVSGNGTTEPSYFNSDVVISDDLTVNCSGGSTFAIGIDLTTDGTHLYWKGTQID